MRHFERESERCQLYTPELAVARTQLLDYFGDLQRAAPAENRLFRFERSMELGVGEGRLLSQLATQLGFAKDEASLGAFLSGQDSAMVDLFPELATFRDVVFMLKAETEPRPSRDRAEAELRCSRGSAERRRPCAAQAMMVPSGDALPELRAWTPMDATLKCLRCP